MPQPKPKAGRRGPVQTASGKLGKLPGRARHPATVDCRNQKRIALGNNVLAGSRNEPLLHPETSAILQKGAETKTTYRAFFCWRASAALGQSGLNVCDVIPNSTTDTTSHQMREAPPWKACLTRQMETDAKTTGSQDHIPALDDKTSLCSALVNGLVNSKDLCSTPSNPPPYGDIGPAEGLSCRHLIRRGATPLPPRCGMNAGSAWSQIRGLGPDAPAAPTIEARQDYY